MYSVSLKNEKLKKSVWEYLSDHKYMFFTVLCAVLCYGYFLTHYAVSIDDLAGDKYYYGGLFAQGRFTSTLVYHLFGLIDNSAWLSDVSGICLLLLSGIIFCTLFDTFSKSKNPMPKIVFSCFLITAPIYVEFIGFNGCTLTIGGGMTLVAIALRCVLKYRQSKKKINLLNSALLLCICTSWYEALEVVYFGGVFALLILETLNSEKKLSCKDVILRGLVYAVPLIVGVVLEYLIQVLIMSVFSIDASYYTMNQSKIFSDKRMSFLKLVAYVVYKNVIAGLWYFPVTMLVIAFVISVVLCVVFIKRTKNISLILLFAGLIFSNFILSFIMWNPAEYRMCEIFAFFVAFIFYLMFDVIYENNEKHLKWYNIIKIITLYLLVMQISSSNFWTNLEYKRYEEEKNVIEQVGYTLNTEYDVSKPVIFTGEYELSDYIKSKSYILNDSFINKSLNKYMRAMGKADWMDNSERYIKKIPEATINSVITWGIHALNENNTQIQKLFSYHGYEFKKCTDEMFKEAESISETMPEWPEKGSIVEYDKYIIVNF